MVGRMHRSQLVALLYTPRGLPRSLASLADGALELRSLGESRTAVEGPGERRARTRAIQPVAQTGTHRPEPCQSEIFHAIDQRSDAALRQGELGSHDPWA